MSPFNHPLLLGFDHLEQFLERVAKGEGSGYPPYNIEQLNDQTLRITLAVAGFCEGDLQVALEDRQLVITGSRVCSENPQTTFLYRGIALRKFQRRFVIADDMKVLGAELENGLLHIDLQRPKVSTPVTHIPIKKKKSTSQSTSKTITIDET